MLWHLHSVGDVAAQDLRCAEIVSVSDAAPVIALALDADGEPALGDRVLVESHRGDFAAAGTIILVDGSRAGVQLSRSRGAVSVGARAWIVSSGLAERHRDVLSSIAYRVGVVDSVLPGGTRIWFDPGGGPWPEDGVVLVRRGDDVLGWGVIAEPQRDAVFVSLRLFHAAVTPVRGDLVEGLTLNRLDRRTRVAGIDDCGELLLAGGGALGAIAGDRFDLFRDGAYVGMAVVQRTSPELVVGVESAFMRTAPRVGDEARLRVKDGRRPGRGWLFRIEGDYGLVSLGEADGVERGQRLMAGALPLDVRTVYPFHSGVRIAEGVDASAGHLSMWMPVSTIPAAADAPRLSADAPWSLVPALRAEVSPRASWLYAVSAAEPLVVGQWVALPTSERVVGFVVATGGDDIPASSVEAPIQRTAPTAWAVSLDGWRY